MLLNTIKSKTLIIKQAELLKNCGAILQTPAELSKTSGTTTTEAPVSGNVSNCYFTSKIPDTSDLEIVWDEKDEHSTAGSQQIMQNCESSSPSVSLSKSQDYEGIQIESFIELKSTLHNPDISLHPHEAHIHLQASVDSPSQTPLKVTNEMETPATVYPTNICNLAAGKGPRIEIQYAYPLTNPVETLRWKLFNSYSLDPQTSSLPRRHHCPNRRFFSAVGAIFFSSSLTRRRLTACSLPTGADAEHRKTLNSFEMLKTTSRDMIAVVPVHPEQAVSQWLKPTIAKYGVLNVTKENSYSTKSSDADRSILGLVAAHWKDKTPVYRSSKQWDGNGIPNSTNKFEEDQRVSWHATPFEERLEKAFSNENSFPKRNCQYGKSPKMEDEESADTAAS
ncbi:protein JASON-like [Zingiber officinale]|uniref:protein JASON-like n=1 Tax=Zingiber officinale TaxID=94328 RepID=UPI001C4CA65D|nr:protein JASON-like [Zingiber officinale]